MCMDKYMDKREYWLWLSNVQGMEQPGMKRLLSRFESPQEIYCCSEKQLISSGAVTAEGAARITASKKKFDINRMKEYLHKNSIQFITVDDDLYPERLKNISDKPYCLYVKGKLPAGGAAAAIVGARACSSGGKQLAHRLGERLAQMGADVISGMARGIDACGHRGALDGGGATYAVLGCGADICYPRENIELYENIVSQGGIISEFAPGTRPESFRFPQRNRIISGLSDTVIVVEAREKSGSLITAEYALSQGRDVLAVPGRVTDELSSGCNRLISDGAQLIADIDEIGELMGIGNKNAVCKGHIKNNENLNYVLEKDFEVVYSETDLFPTALDELVSRTGMSTERIHEIVFRLELDGLIYEPAKNYYARKI